MASICSNKTKEEGKKRKYKNIWSFISIHGWALPGVQGVVCARVCIYMDIQKECEPMRCHSDDLSLAVEDRPAYFPARERTIDGENANWR